MTERNTRLIFMYITIIIYLLLQQRFKTQSRYGKQEQVNMERKIGKNISWLIK